MATQIFVNLPVRDLARSIEFFGRLGYRFDPRFTDESATCMLVGEGIFVMLLTGKRFQEFTPKPVADARAATEVLLALSCDSRAEVERLAEAAFALGARRTTEPKDLGFMFQWGYEDLDGHLWELFWMDPQALAEQPPA